MAKTYEFTENASGARISIVIDKIATFKKDEFSECTSIELIDGKKIGVSESVDEVRKVIENAQRP